MRFQSPLVLTFSICTLFLVTGCGKSKSTEAKPAKTGKEVAAPKGPNGGMIFDIGQNHEYKAELVFKQDPKTVTVYLLTHDHPYKPVLSKDATITLTDLKDEGTAIKPITLAAKPKDGETAGSSRFEATGEAVTADDDHAFPGGKFQVKIGDKTLEAHIEGHDDHDH